MRGNMQKLNLGRRVRQVNTHIHTHRYARTSTDAHRQTRKHTQTEILSNAQESGRFCTRVSPSLKLRCVSCVLFLSHACVRVCAHARVCVCACVHARTCVCTCMRVCVYACLRYSCMHVSVHARVHVRSCVRACVHSHVNASAHACGCMYVGL